MSSSSLSSSWKSFSSLLSTQPSSSSSSSLPLLSSPPYQKMLSLSAQSFWHLMAVVVLMFAHLSVQQSVAVMKTPSPSSTSILKDVAGATGIAGISLAARSNDKNAVAVMTRGQNVIDAVPKEDRSTFILHQLSLALKAAIKPKTINPHPRFSIDRLVNATQVAKFKLIPTYSKFKRDLLNWTLQNFGLTKDELALHLSSRQAHRLCTSRGSCFRKASIGKLCCPF